MHLLHTQFIVGSSPTITTSGSLVEWLRRLPVTQEIMGSSPIRVAIYNVYAGIAQLVEHFLAKEDVASSSLVSRSRLEDCWSGLTALFAKQMALRGTEVQILYLPPMVADRKSTRLNSSH